MLVGMLFLLMPENKLCKFSFYLFSLSPSLSRFLCCSVFSLSFAWQCFTHYPKTTNILFQCCSKTQIIKLKRNKKKKKNKRQVDSILRCWMLYDSRVLGCSLLMIVCCRALLRPPALRFWDDKTLRSNGFKGHCFFFLLRKESVFNIHEWIYVRPWQEARILMSTENVDCIFFCPAKRNWRWREVSWMTEWCRTNEKCELFQWLCNLEIFLYNAFELFPGMWWWI